MLRDSENTALAGLCTVLTTLGMLATFAILGWNLGYGAAPQGENGWFDMREAPKLLAAMVVGTFGGVFGLALGLLAGSRLARWPLIGWPVACCSLALPLITCLRSSAQQAELQRSQAHWAGVQRQEEANHAAYLGSQQYADRVTTETSALNTFVAAMGDLNYPGSVLEQFCVPSALVYRTDDPYGAVRQYFSSRAREGKEYSNHETSFHFTQGPYSGAIYIDGPKDGVGPTRISFAIDR